MEKSRSISELREIVDEICYSTSVPKWSRFDYKQAHRTGEISTTYGRFELFKSYNTIVMVIDLDNKVAYECGKYSQTTSKQCTQFINKFYPEYTRVFVEYI